MTRFADVTLSILIDISDLVYYIARHDHLTGIQRVQACIIENLMASEECIEFISFNTSSKTFWLVDAEFVKQLVDELSLPVDDRRLEFDRRAAQVGQLPRSTEIVIDRRVYSQNQILMLGAAWAVEDYFRHINLFRDRLGAQFVCVIHDLIPIFARETCHQGTAIAFRNFMASSRLSTDLYICVSDNTRRDLLRYFAANDWPEPKVAVVRHATGLPSNLLPQKPEWLSEHPNGFVLCVSTIEGRKNHNMLFSLWRRLIADFPGRAPQLVCIGRIGWRSENFLIRCLASDGLARQIIVQSDVSDQELAYLYATCRFTIYPSLYEGWGLPISESLAFGKLCICSHTSSMPEAGGDFAVYIDPADLEGSYDVVRGLLASPDRIAATEDRLRREFQPRTWAQVASEYLAAMRGCAEHPLPTVVPRLPCHLAFRTVKHDYDGVLGDHLLDQIAQNLRSDFKPCALQLDVFENGHLARGDGDWMAPEPWGAWIGLKGASLWLQAESERDYLAYMSYINLPPFHGSRLKIVSNGETTLHPLTAPPQGFGTLVLEFTARPGKNVITFVGAPTDEQIKASFAIDPRGLMFGLREIVCLAKDDLEGRMNLLQALARH